MLNTSDYKRRRQPCSRPKKRLCRDSEDDRFSYKNTSACMLTPREVPARSFDVTEAPRRKVRGASLAAGEEEARGRLVSLLLWRRLRSATAAARFHKLLATRLPDIRSDTRPSTSYRFVCSESRPILLCASCGVILFFCGSIFPDGCLS